MTAQGTFTLYSSVTNSTHQPIKRLSGFPDSGCWKQVKIMAETNMEDLSSHKGKKLKSYNIQFKLGAIKFAEENSNHSVWKVWCCSEENMRVERQ